LRTDTWSKSSVVLSALFVAALSFFLLLHNPLGITNLLVANEQESIASLVGIALILIIIAFKWSGGYCRIAKGVYFLIPTFAVCYVGIKLVGIWGEPSDSFFLIGGAIPNSDAQGWIGGAWRLLEFGELDSWSQRRPLNALLHSLRLLVTGDLRTSIALGALLVALGSFLVSLQIRSCLGWIPAAIVFIGLIDGIEPYLATTMTEVHGLLFGCLSFALLWSGAEKKSLREIFLGLVFLSIGLSVRSGPFLIYPFLVAWLLLEFKGEKRSHLIVMGSVATLAVGPVFSWLLIQYWGDGSNLAQSNFGYTLYGMAAGTGDWARIMSERPELFVGKTEREIANDLWRLSFGMIQEHPQLILRYYWEELVEFMGSFLRYDLGVSPILGLCALLGGLWRLKLTTTRLLLAVFLGTVLSAPFLMDTAGARPFVVVLPFVALVNAIGVFAILDIINRFFPKTGRIFLIDKKAGSAEMKLTTISLLMIGALLISPLLFPANRVTNSKVIEICPIPQVAFAISGLNSSVVNIVRTFDWKLGVIPSIPHSVFLSDIPLGEYGARYRLAVKTSPPYSFVKTLGNDKQQIQLVIKPPLSIMGRIPQVFCGLPKNHSSYLSSSE
jgi:hypothetical protein